jgi:hypothetical protein
MQNVQMSENKEAVIVPIKRWKKMKGEIASLKKRLKKAETLNDFRKSLTNLKHDLQDENYNVEKEVSADDFLAEMRNAE